MPDPDHLFTACPLMSPDGSRLACGGFGEDRFENPTDPSLNGIYTIRSSDGGGLTRMTSNPGGEDMPGDYSPNGKRLVFGRFDENEEPVGLYVTKTNGTHLRPIMPPGTIVTSGGDWSPQGNAIVFSRRVSAEMRNRCGSCTPTAAACTRSTSKANRRAAARSPSRARAVASIHAGHRTARRSSSASSRTPPARTCTSSNADGTGLTQVTDGGDDEAPDWGTHPLAH